MGAPQAARRYLALAASLTFIAAWGHCAEVHFDQASGFRSSSFSVILSSPGPGATIFYTTNGTRPSVTAGYRYERPILLSTTTVLRAAAFPRGEAIAEGWRTYLFAEDILNQAGAGWPTNWGASQGRAVAPYYGMAKEVVQDPADRKLLLEGLASIPSLSIIADPDALFHPDTGIYTHSTNRGSAWERPADVELIPPEGSGFRARCGLRVHGGLSRLPEESPKHSFRLIFRKQYGSSTLRFPLFGPNGSQQCDALILRAGNNNSWLHSEARERRRADYVRDEWMRQSMLAMGYPSARGFFVHLYLNGLYWGLYNLCEEPGLQLFASNQQVARRDYDLRKGKNILAGDPIAWDRMMFLANSGLEESSNYVAIQRDLDLVKFADYLILNLFAGNADWDRDSNWYALRPRNPAGKFQFLVWDSERTLEAVDANTTRYDDDESPPRLFQKLSENPEFRLLFAERARKLLLSDGPLASGPAADRYRRLAHSIEEAIVAESARWGSYRRDVHPYKVGSYELYTLEKHWQPEVERLLGQYFPQRPEVVLKQFRERGLFPE